VKLLGVVKPHECGGAKCTIVTSNHHHEAHFLKCHFFGTLHLEAPIFYWNKLYFDQYERSSYCARVKDEHFFV
jgi:hypothetical protein